MELQRAALVCSAIAALLYVNTLDCGYCYDDDSAIILNRDLLPETPWSKLLEDDFWGASMTDITSHKSYRPLTVATFRLNYMLHELQPLGYHLVNVLLHSAVCYLYVLLCGVVFSEVWPALIAGLLFAVHPIHTEAVAGRAELLCSIFYIASLLFYKKTTSTESGIKSKLWLCGVLVSTLCSALSKEQGITVVAVDLRALFLFKVKLKNQCCSEKSEHFSRDDAVKLKSFVARTGVLAVFAAVFMMFRLRVMGGSMPTFYFEEANPAALEPSPYRQLSWLYLCFINLWLLLNPSPLCADWANGTVPLVLSVIDGRNIATLTLFATTAALTVSAIRREKTSVLFALSLLVLPYLPASNLFFPVGFVVAERVLYLPSMGFCMLVATAHKGLKNKVSKSNKIAKWIPNLIKTSLIFILLIQSAKTVTRNRDWYSEDILWKSALSVNPRNSKVFTNLAREFEERNETEKALKFSEHALKLQPKVMLQWVNVAFAHKSLGHMQEAEKYLRGALTLVPEGKKMSFQVGHRMVNVYGELGEVIKRNESRLKEATHLFRKAVSLEQTSAMKSHWMMAGGECFVKMNDLDSAMNQFISANDIDPSSVDTNHNLAMMYGKTKDLAKAERYLRRALDVNRDHVSSLVSLATILGDSNDSSRQEEAMLLHARAAQIQPTNYKHLWRKGKLHLNRREFDQAKPLFFQALRLNPDQPQVMYSLGKMYSEQGFYGEAVAVLEKVVAAVPESKMSVTLLAEAYRHTGETQRAMELERQLQAGTS